MMLKQGRTKPPKVDIIPMVDIVFQLIIFFLVATQVKQEETAVDIRLPRAQESQELKQEQQQILLINVVRPEIARNAGERPYVYDRRSMNLDELKTMLGKLKAIQDERGGKAPVVRIRGDRDSSFEDVRKALAACVDIGIQEVRIATEKKQ